MVTNDSFDLVVTKGMVPGTNNDVVRGIGNIAGIDFTPKKPGYWAIEVDFTAVWTLNNAPVVVNGVPAPTYSGKGTAFLVAAQATIATNPPSVTNVIVGQQLNLSMTVLPNDIDTKSGQSVGASKNDSTTYNWTVPNDPLTGWDFAANKQDCHARKSLLSNDPKINPTNNTKLSNVTFFWYHNGSNSGTTQTVSATISDPAWTGGDGMPISLTPTQNFTLYQPDTTFTASAVKPPLVLPYSLGNTTHFELGIGDAYADPENITDFGIFFTRQGDDSSIIKLLNTSSGTYQWCQTIQHFDVKAFNPSEYLDGPTKAEALDGRLHLAGDPVWAFGATNPSQTADSPSTDILDNLIDVTADEQFTMYMMYTPPPLQGNASSFPVPLRKLQWSWQAHWALDPMNVWRDQGSTSNSTQSETADYPTWADWASNYSLLWKKQNP